MQPQRRLLLLSHYMYTQSIKMMMMRMIVTLMVIMMMRAPISFKKVQPDILDFTFNKEFLLSLLAKVGIGLTFGFHFQKKLELD